MLYKKPDDVTYTQMAIYIDEHVYDPECTEDQDNLIFQYIYHIVYMLAHKGKFFNKAQYYEDFAIYMATQVFMRLRNKKQYEFKDDGTAKLKKIKSVLNYIKKTIDPRRVDFQQEFFTQTILSVDEENYTTDVHYTLANQLSQSIDEMAVVDFNVCLSDICRTAKEVIKNIPYKKDKATFNNIYLSCLLTFLNSITLRRQDIVRLESLKRGKLGNPQLVEDLYTKQSENCVILYHLDKNMTQYIEVLTRKMKHAIAKDLSMTLHTYVPSDDGFKNLIMSEVNNEVLYED